MLLAEGLRPQTDGEVLEVVTVLAHQRQGVIIAEVVKADGHQVGEAGGEQAPQIRLPAAVGQLEQETQTLLKCECCMC